MLAVHTQIRILVTSLWCERIIFEHQGRRGRCRAGHARTCEVHVLYFVCWDYLTIPWAGSPIHSDGEYISKSLCAGQHSSALDSCQSLSARSRLAIVVKHPIYYVELSDAMEVPYLLCYVTLKYSPEKLSILNITSSMNPSQTDTKRPKTGTINSVSDTKRQCHSNGVRRRPTNSSQSSTVTTGSSLRGRAGVSFLVATVGLTFTTLL